VLVSGAGDLVVYMWDMMTGMPQTELHTEGYSMDYRSDGLQLATGTLKGLVILWDPTSATIVAQLKGHTKGVSKVVYRRDGQQLASGSRDTTVRLWEIASGSLITELKGHTREVSSLAFRGDGQQLASGSLDSTVCLWDTASGTLTTTLKGHTKGVSSVAYRSDGLWLASGSSDMTVCLWDTASGSLIATLKGHTLDVSCVAYRSDGKQLASGSKDNTVRLWDAINFEQVVELKGLVFVDSVTYRDDGLQLAAGDMKGCIYVWTSCSLDSIRWTLTHRFTNTLALFAENADLRGVFSLSPINHKLLQQYGANVDQLPAFLKTSATSVHLFGCFFSVVEGRVPDGGTQIAAYLSDRDQQSLACVNRSCYSFFAQLRHIAKIIQQNPLYSTQSTTNKEQGCSCTVL